MSQIIEDEVKASNDALDAAEAANDPNAPTVWWKRNVSGWIPVAIVGGTLAYLFGAYHLFRSENGDLIPMKKAHFSFSDTFVQIEKVALVKYEVAKATHPLALETLVEAGVVQSPEQLEEKAREMEKFRKEHPMPTMPMPGGAMPSMPRPSGKA